MKHERGRKISAADRTLACRQNTTPQYSGCSRLHLYTRTVRRPYHHKKDGTPFLDTFGIYINKITDMEYREELLKVLIPMQHEVELSCFDCDKTEADEEDINNRMEM